jgi:hypothetical protein
VPGRSCVDGHLSHRRRLRVLVHYYCLHLHKTTPRDSVRPRHGQIRAARVITTVNGILNLGGVIEIQVSLKLLRILFGINYGVLKFLVR